MFQAEWTGGYPNLCSGEWLLQKDGVDISNLIPEDYRNDSMNTLGTYQRWYFDENYNEVFEDYVDGLDCQDWIRDNPWIKNIAFTPDEAEDLYRAFQEQDWRHGSCGGCI